MNSCPFCLPDASKSTFAESQNFIALYNIAPILPGHSMVVPKVHVTSFQEIDETMMTEMVVFSRKIMAVLEKAFGTNSFNWTIQEGIAAGQTVQHMHLHIIPRQKDDLPNPGDWYPLLVKDESKIIDSFYRTKHAPVDMQKIIRHLGELYNSLFTAE